MPAGCLVLGIGGAYCAGKSEVSRFLESLGAHHIDVDSLGHQVLEQRRGEVAERFGPSIVRRDGSVDRKALGARVFSDPTGLRDLEAILHPAMKIKVWELVGAIKKEQEQSEKEEGAPDAEDSGARIERPLNFLIVVNAALLFKMGLAGGCDKVLWIRAPFLLRLFRGLARDGLGLKPTLRRMLSQKGLFAQSSAKDADTLRVNNISLRRTKELVLRYIREAREADARKEPEKR